MTKPTIVILISGRGSNMMSIIDAIEQATLAATIAAVISNRPDAPGLKLAEKAGINTVVIDDHEFTSRDMFDKALAEQIDRYAPTLVVLAGFMRILTAEFVRHFAHKLVNIHPSLLPKFKGLNTHQRAIDAGEKEHGATVHLVTAKLDDGPVILQARVPVLPNDTADTLAARVLKKEHDLYPRAINKLMNTISER